MSDQFGNHRFRVRFCQILAPCGHLCRITSGSVSERSLESAAGPSRFGTVAGQHGGNADGRVIRLAVRSKAGKGRWVAIQSVCSNFGHPAVSSSIGCNRQAAGRLSSFGRCCRAYNALSRSPFVEILCEKYPVFRVVVGDRVSAECQCDAGR